VENREQSQPNLETGPNKMLETIRNIARCEKGATAVEYGLIASLIVVAMLTAIGSVATSTSEMWNTISNQVTEVNN
jgi:pilus assembly protein Flp/PilA